MIHLLFNTFVQHSTNVLRLLPHKKKLHRFSSIGLALLMLSCATTPPKETYITSANLSGISKVAIVASANAPDLSYVTQSTSPGPLLATAILFPILIFPAIAIEGIARSGADSSHAKEIGKRVDLTSIEDKIADVFSGSIVSAGCFKSVERIKNKNQEEQLLSTSGYDAIIRLKVYEISLDRRAGDYVGLHIHVQGQLKNLRSGQILWDREEMVTAPESHQLDYYKENGLKELNALLEKAGKMLAYDFVYLK
jgi:hypothetical protein